MNEHKTITIRAGHGTLDFLITERDGSFNFIPYDVKDEMSIAANLREAFKSIPQLSSADKARLMVSSPVILIPKEDYTDVEEFDVEAVYSSVMTGHRGEEKIVKEVYDLEAMGIFACNSDLQMVVRDNCKQVDVLNVIMPVWKHLYNRYYQAGQRRKLFAYFHDKVVDVCSFEQRRVRFANVFEAQHAHDALYYILYVWKQLGMDQQEDDLFVVGNMPHEEWLRERLGLHIARIHTINPSADLNRSPLAKVEGMQFDMMIKA